MSKLTDLDSQFLIYKTERRPVMITKDTVTTIEERETEIYQGVDSIVEAQGVQFQCPKCSQDGAQPIGAHYVICWFRDRGIPDHVQPKPGRWVSRGTGLHDLTLEPSILITSGCNWHGFIREGQIVHA